MPHSRPRHILNQFLNRMKFSRVVSIQGARQVGKSFFARHLVKAHFPKSEYVTLDKQMDRDFARSNPENFIESFNGIPLIIDEAQKASNLFDTIKWKVDETTKPGQFLLLGSSEFSKEVQIRESLTGRLSRVRLYSLNLAETQLQKAHRKPFSLLSENPWAGRKLVLKHLEKGGFPGIFSIHQRELFHESVTDWIKLTIERDLLQFPKIKVDADLAMKVFALLAKLDEPTNANIAKALRCSARTSQKILDLLEVLFAVHKLNPHSLGTGKPLYFYCDVALASFYGADFRRKLWTWALHEQLSQRSYIGDRTTTLSYYRNSKGSLIHLVLEDDRQLCPIKIIDTEKWDSRDFEILKAFEKRAGQEGKKISLMAFASRRFRLKNPRIEIYPFEALA